MLPATIVITTIAAAVLTTNASVVNDTSVAEQVYLCTSSCRGGL
ncbi:hypothetical protein [Candidatus Clavichlamydia salmonicola]|nr:hypothetical protein [Candidatus Clavichlamydia salmonicola]